jgi:hypothetical protein
LVSILLGLFHKIKLLDPKSYSTHHTYAQTGLPMRPARQKAQSSFAGAIQKPSVSPPFSPRKQKVRYESKPIVFSIKIKYNVIPLPVRRYHVKKASRAVVGHTVLHAACGRRIFKRRPACGSVRRAVCGTRLQHGAASNTPRQANENENTEPIPTPTRLRG